MLLAAALLVVLAAFAGGCAALGPDASNPLLPTAAAPVRAWPVPSVMPAWRAWFKAQAANDETIARIVTNRGIAESARFTQLTADGHIVDVYFTAAETIPGLGAGLWKAAYVATWEPDGEGWRFEVRDELKRQDPPGPEKLEGATY
jgi:hypothetical protein